MSFASRIGIVFAKKWIGGITISDALRESEKLNVVGEKVIINYLGEELTDSAKVRKTVNMYIEILKDMESDGVQGSIAVKPTQLGLNINYRTFFSNYEKIADCADGIGMFVWMDMEDYMTVDSSIKAYISLLKKHKNLGICIQAKLIRSLDDIMLICKNKGVVRLVKGAYRARDHITYSQKSEVDRNYLRCMGYLFKNSAKFMVATHDSRIIDIAKDMEKRYHKKVMFGMLKGIRQKLAQELVSEHEDMHIYMPFGEEWLNYSARRLKELEHSVLIIRSIISG